MANTTDGLVRVLPETLANKIAAGEVVQRPASALKELLENSLDAGARNVEVILRDAGSELIQVIDDGCGMSEADALACFGRHATSKIKDIEDLGRIRTLGFRGEALASISSVAQVELRSRLPEEDAATLIRIDGGEVREVAPAAAPPGTSIAVRRLFYNVPARRNFMKAPATELRHLIETFQQTAVSHPQIGFTLVNDDNELYRLPATNAAFQEALAARLRGLFGERVADELVPVSESTSYLSIRGVVGAPSLARKRGADTFLFVNDRFVRHRALEHAVASAFAGLIPDEARPLFALFLSLDPRHVDVNVHPTKTEVKFDDERGIYSMVRSVVKKALGDAEMIPTLGDGFEHSVFAEVAPAGPPLPTAFPAGGSHVRGADATRFEDWSGIPPAEIGLATGVPSEAQPLDSGDAEEALALETEPPVWPLHGRYLVTPIRSGLLFVDQRLAHERILYEQAIVSMHGGLGASQQLVFPIVIDLPPEELRLVEELLPDLRSLGFHVEPFGGRTVKIHGVPADVRSGSEQSILEDMLADFREQTGNPGFTRQDALARSFARRRALRHGDSLSEKQARSLIDQLFACREPLSAPDGRPTTTRLSMQEIDRHFGRS